MIDRSRCIASFRFIHAARLLSFKIRKMKKKPKKSHSIEFKRDNESNKRQIDSMAVWRQQFCNHYHHCVRWNQFNVFFISAHEWMNLAFYVTLQHGHTRLVRALVLINKSSWLPMFWNPRFFVSSISSRAKVQIFELSSFKFNFVIWLTQKVSFIFAVIRKFEWINKTKSN